MRRIPVYPAADGYALRRATSRCSHPTSRPSRRCPRCSRRSQRALAGLNRYPDPTTRALRAACRDRYGVPRRAHRHRQRLLRHPARRRRGAARAGRRGRLRLAVVLASTRTSPRRPARARSRSRSTTHDRHDLDAMAAEITAATRLVIVCNPNNPTSTALPLGEIEALRRRRCRATSRDPRRGLLRVQRCSTTPTSRSTCWRHPNLVAAAHLLEGLRPVRRCGSASRLRLGGLPPRGRPGAPAVLLQRRRPGRRDRGAAPPGRGRAPRRARPSPSACSSTSGLRELGLSAADSQANFSGSHLGEDADEAEIVRGLAEQGVLVRAGAALGRERRAARHRTAPTQENEPLPASARATSSEPATHRHR